MSVDSYALALLALNDAKVAITSDNIAKVLKKSKCESNKQTIDLFAEVAKYINLDDLLAKFSSVGAGSASAAAPAASAAAPVAAAAAKEAEKSESEESEADMGFGLFD